MQPIDDEPGMLNKPVRVQDFRINLGVAPNQPVMSQPQDVLGFIATTRPDSSDPIHRRRSLTFWDS